MRGAYYRRQTDSGQTHLFMQVEVKVSREALLQETAGLDLVPRFSGDGSKPLFFEAAPSGGGAMVGLFIPKGSDRSRVAEEIRRIHGPEAALYFLGFPRDHEYHLVVTAAAQA